MGKRELLLIGVFVALGAVAYWAAAPPPAPGEGGFSLSGLVDELRREMGETGPRVERRVSARAVAGPDVETIRIDDFTGRLTVVGSDVQDVQADLRGDVRGVDERDAGGRAGRIGVDLRVSEGILHVDVSRPRSMRPPRMALTLRVPRRLVVETDVSDGPTEIRGVASVRLRGRGETRIDGIAGRVEGSYFRGDLRVTRAGSVALQTRRADVRIERVEGAVSLTATGGRVRVRSVGGELRVEGDGSEISAHLSSPVSSHLETRNDDIEVFLPADAGVSLDAEVRLGELRLDNILLDVIGDQRESRVVGPVEGGGPRITARVVGGDLVVRR